jgi:hypothetical protein
MKHLVLIIILILLLPNIVYAQGHGSSEQDYGGSGVAGDCERCWELVEYYKMKAMPEQEFANGKEFCNRLDQYQLYVLDRDVCVPLTRLIVQILERRGYDVETEILENQHHAVIKAYIGNQIWYYDFFEVTGKRCWCEYWK